MDAAAHETETNIGTASPVLSVTVALAQAGLIAALLALWSAPAADASATTVDWAYVALTFATPVVLVLSGWVGRRLGRRLDPRGPVAGRYVARGVQRATLGLAVLALAFAPIGILGALVLDPMG